MADKKISALTAATTPLAGTEVLPIVQSGSTVKVAVSNLTAGRDISTTGITVSSNTGNIELNWAAGSTHKVGSTFSTTFFTGMRVDADSRNTDIISFDASGAGNVRLRTGVTETTRLNVDPTGNVTVSTGNLVVGTAAKGIDFSANANAPGMTSELLNWYETGTFTPAWGGSTTDPTNSYTSRTGRYTRIGDIVYCWVELVTSASSGGSGNLQIKGLPFAARDAELNAGFASGFSLNFPSGCFANSTTTVTMTATVPGVEQAYLGIATLGASSYLACTIMYRIA